MGHLRAMEAATVMTEMAGAEAAMHYHLTANHYPPVPSEMVPVALEAVSLFAAGDPDGRVELPDGITYRDGSTSVAASLVVQSLHLDAFVEVAMEEVTA